MKAVLMAAAAACALVACGGGGGDEPLPVPPAPPQVQALDVWKDLISSDRTFVTRGTGSDGAAFEVSTSIRPRGVAQMGQGRTFSSGPLVSYTAVEVTNAVRRNNAAYSTSSQLLYIAPADFSLAAMIDPDGTTSGPSCIFPESAVQTPPVPQVAALNAVGPLFSGRSFVYAGASKLCYDGNGVLGAPTHKLTWSYEADNGRPLFCVNYTMQYTTQDVRDQNMCFEVSGGASIASGARVSLSSRSLRFAAKNY